MTSKAEKVLNAISKMEFFVEWLLNSQNTNGFDNFMSALVVIEGLKFYYKLECFFNSKSIYMEEPELQDEQKGEQFITQPQNIPATLEHMNKVLESIKTKSYLTKHNIGVTEQTSSGKKIALPSLTPLSNRFTRKSLSYVEIFGQLLYIIRPLAYIIVLKVCGTKNYKAWVTALVIDLVRWLIQSRMSVRSTRQLAELSKRKSEMISKACFRPPFYSTIFKSKIVEPILNRLMSCDRWIYRIIMYILEMKSSITLTI